MQHLGAGLICALVSLVFSLSYAVLIFSGPLAPWLSYGLAATFVTAAVGAAIMTARSSLGFPLASPDAPTSAVSAALAAGLAGQALLHGAQENLLAVAVAGLALSAILAGILLYAIGRTHSSRIIRFIPYPVIGGFLAATGWLIGSGAVQIVTGYALSARNLLHLTAPGTALQLSVGILVAAIVLTSRSRFRSSSALILQLVTCGLAIHLGLWLFGLTLKDAQANGWTFTPPGGITIASPWSIMQTQGTAWQVLPLLAGDFLAVMFVTAVSILLNVSALELISRRDADLDRDLATLGMTNIAAGLLGGYVNGVPLSRSTLSYSLAGISRIPGLMVALSSAVMLLVDARFLAYVPKAVLGGLLLSLAFDVLQKWLVSTYRQLALLEYLALVSIAAIIVLWGFIPGIIVGLVIGSAIFALNASRVRVIKFGFDGSEYRSSLDRGLQELSILRKDGGKIKGLVLQSYLFFGSANGLYEHVKELLTAQPGCRFLVIDFRLVIGIDSSASHSFVQMKRIAAKAGVELVLVSLADELRRSLSAMGVITRDLTVQRDLDEALEACENAIIAEHERAGTDAASLREWLLQVFHDGQFAEILAAECRAVQFRAGQVIARQGERAGCMYFILDGRIGIRAATESGRLIRLRSLGPRTTVGEMGLITGEPRSATIEAEADSTLYQLSAEAFYRLSREQPRLVQALLRYVIGLMSERLAFSNRTVTLLHR
jgi:sulfate permease, SulP family